MKILLIALFTFISIHLFGQTNFVERQGGHSYTLEIPDYMQRVYDLNEVATMQAMGEDPESYLIVIDDSKEELDYFNISFTSAHDFLNNFTATYNSDAENRKLGDISAFSAHDNKYAQVKMTWTYEEIDFFMLITVVETDTHYYKILAWTTADNSEKLLDDFVRLSSSLRDK